MNRSGVPRTAVAAFLLVACTFLPGICASAQSIQENIRVDLVNVYVTATDRDGRFVQDLKNGELEILEDGMPQRIEFFTNFALEPEDRLGDPDVPLTVAFVIDTSSSMSDAIAGQTKIDIVRSAALRLLDELRAQDRMMLVGFSDYPDETTPLTSDRKKFTQDLLFQDIKGGNTALLDAVYFAMQKMKDAWGRKIIVLCSDGEDTASYLKVDEVLSNLVASDVTVLAFGTMGLTTTSMRGRIILEKLANASGGYAFFPTSMKKLETVMEQLRQGMRSQYSLAYKPGHLSAEGAWHRIEVRCKRQGLKLRYREGYFAHP